MEPIPFHEGEPPPGPEYVLAKMISEHGSEQLVWVDPDELHKGPLCQGDIDDLLPVIRWQWRHLREYATWCRSFEDWELGYLRDSNPEQEVAIWSQCTYAFLEFSQEHSRVDRGHLLNAIVAMTNGHTDSIKPPAVAARLQELFINMPESLRELSNFTEDGYFTGGAAHLR